MIQQNKPKNKNLFLSILSALLITFTILSLSAFKPAPINEVLYLPIFDLVEEKASIPSIFPIEEDKIEKISSYYGMRYNPINKEKKMHTGIDIVAPKGTPILATADGTIELAEYAEGMGNHIRIKHNKTYGSMYAHMEKLEVKQGDKVSKGDVIGIIGTTGRSLGVHLHYEVLKNEERVNPVDYLPNNLEERK